MSLERENVQKFSELDAEVRTRLLIEYIGALRSGIKDNPKLLENHDVEKALKMAYGQLEKEFGK